MTNKLVTFFLLVGGVFATSVLLLAHHSDSVADQTKLVVITGTVMRFAFVNPHSTIYLAVKNEKGQVEEWAAWGGNPDQYRPAGWTKHTFQPGDKLTIYGFQHRDGTKGMIHLKIFRPNEEVPGGRNERQSLENYESVYGKQQFAYRPEQSFREGFPYEKLFEDGSIQVVASIPPIWGWWNASVSSTPTHSSGRPTLTDPKVFVKPFVERRTLKSRSNYDFTENIVCEEHYRKEPF